MKHIKLMVIAAAMAAMVFGMHTAHAQVATNQTNNPAFPAVEVTSMTDTYNAASHTISGAAYFKNDGSTPTTIGFTESLYFGSKEKFSLLEFIGSVVAPQTVSLAAGETTRVPYSYTVPQNINTGDYVFRIRVLTQDSSAELAFLDEDIHLIGSGNFLDTVPGLSFITVGDNQYGLGEGVAFASPAQALLHVALQNNTAHTISGTPQATIRIRGANGTIVKTFTPSHNTLTVDSGQTVDYIVTLPVLDPQVYVYSLSFTDQSHNAIAPLVQGRYIINGPSAKILYLGLDKNYYPAGSTAVVTVAVIGPADGTTLPKDGTLEINLVSNGKAIQNIEKNISLSAAEQNFTFNVSVSQPWYNPSVQAHIVYDGKVLDSAGQNLTSPNKPPLITLPHFSAGDWLFIGLGIIILGLVIILLVRGRKTKLMHAALILMLFAGYLATAHTIYASTQTTSSSANWWEGNTEYYGTITLQATVPDSVNVGSSLSASGTVVLNSCSNASFTGNVYARISDYGNASSYYVSGRDSSPGSFYMTMNTSGESGGYHSVLVHAIGNITFPQSGRTQPFDLLLTFSTNFIAPTHYTCSGNSCVQVSGAGSNQCYSSYDCSTPTYHNACQNNSCVSVSGSGSNQCTSSSDCYTAPPSSHNICSNYSCISVSGSGSNQCYYNSNCGTPPPPPPTYYFWNYTIIPVDSSTGQVLSNAFYTFATNCYSPSSAQSTAQNEWNNGQFIYGSDSVYTTCSNNYDWYYFYTVSSFTQGSAIYNYQSYNQSGGNGYFTIRIYYQKQPQYTVSVTKTGTGSGTVTSNYGMNCGSTCSEQINSGNTDYLYASPSTNSVFSGWSGACSGTGICALSMNSNKAVTATFTYNPPPPPTVSLTANPSSIYTGQWSSLSWSSTNATSCTKSGSWNGNASTSGFLNVQPSSTSTYTLTCVNSVGTAASRSATVTVLPLSYTIGITSSASGILITSSVAGNSPYPYPSYYIVQNNPFSTILSAPNIASSYGGLYVFSTWAHDAGVAFTNLGLSGSNYRAQAAEYSGTQGFNASNRTVSAHYTPYYFDISPAANPTSGIAPLTVSFLANPSTNVPQDLPHVTYSWNFGDGTTTTQENPTHTFSKVGTYKVVLTATDVDASQVLGSTVVRTVNLTINAQYANPQYKETTPTP